MKKEQIRTDVVKKSLLDYDNLANTLRENTESAVKSLLDEAVRDTYAKLLSEDEDYEEEEVEDTETPSAEEDKGDEGKVEDVDEEPTADEPEQGASDEGTEETLEDDEDEWAAYDEYKTGDGTYDFSNAKDEDIVKVYKLVSDDDQFLVKQDGDTLKLKDDESGNEYLIDLGSSDDKDDINDFEKDYDDMNESQENLYELVLEYDSNVGYTDNYQKGDVMTNPGMSEPGKNVNDWDSGVPKGTSKPWSGYPSKKRKADKPFTAGRGKTVEEESDIEPTIEDDANLEEGGGRYGAVQKHTRSKKHIGTNPEEEKHPKVSHSNSTSEKGYTVDNTNEAFERKLNKIVRENKELIGALGKFKDALKEAAVVNYNLGQVIKLISENSTTKDEKKEIISRFNNEAHTIKESAALYESISRELKKSDKMEVNESKTQEQPKMINETSIYKSQDVLDSLDLMHRMM